MNFTHFVLNAYFSHFVYVNNCFCFFISNFSNFVCCQIVLKKVFSVSVEFKIVKRELAMDTENLVKNRIFRTESESSDINYFNDGMEDILNETISKFEEIRETPKIKREMAPRKLITSIDALEPFHTPKKKFSRSTVNKIKNSIA